MRNTLKTIASAAVLAAATLATAIGADAASLKVTNMTNVPIALVYVSPSASSTWRGSQLLGDSQFIMPGETWSLEFAGGGSCYFDLRAVFTDTTEIEHDTAYLCGTDKTWYVGR